MGNTRDTGHLRNVILYDSSGKIAVGGTVDTTYLASIYGATKLNGLIDITCSFWFSSITITNGSKFNK